MNTIIAIDPGYSRHGEGNAIAFFHEGTLVGTGYARSDEVMQHHDRVDEVVWECPQVDARTRMSVPAIVALAAEGGTMAGLYAGLLPSVPPFIDAFGQRRQGLIEALQVGDGPEHFLQPLAASLQRAQRLDLLPQPRLVQPPGHG